MAVSLPNFPSFDVHAGGSPLEKMAFTATVTFSNASTSTLLLVVKERNGNLPSYKAAQKLGLITVSVNIATNTDRYTNKSKSLKEEFKSLFGGIGKYQRKK